jgi:hypothetical protein
MRVRATGTQSRERASVLSAADKPRRNIVALVTLVYLLLMFEGALRKYLLPSFGQLLFFVRDPFVLAVYALALRHSLVRRSRLLTAGVVFGAVGVLLIALQGMGVASGIAKWPILAVYGWRNYFFYIPLPFIVGAVFKAADLKRIVKLTLILSIPIAFLVVLQFRSPPDAPINVGYGASVEQQFHGLTVDVDHTRPSGTFSSDVGEREFVVSCVAMLMTLWIMPAARRFLKSWQLLVATGAVLSCLAVSGSRGAMLASAIVVVVAVGSGTVLKGSGASARAILLPIVIVVAAILLFPIVFPDGYSTFTNRWIMANAAESQQFSLGVFGRALYGFVDFLSLMGNTPITGYGLGLAGNASLTLGVTIPGFTGWAETDWARHIVDLGPLFGVAFIIFRLILVGWLGVTSISGARRTGSPLPLLLFAFVGNELLAGELTGNGTVNGYAWLFAGFCLAACRARLDPEVIAEVPAERSIDTRRFANLMP